MGAVRSTQRSKWVDPAAKRYSQYKGTVRLLANVAGVPGEIPRGFTAKVALRILWNRRAKADLDNVVKGILDALWRQDRAVAEIDAAYSVIEMTGNNDDVALVNIWFKETE